METSQFGGVVGQVVNQFVSKSTLISAIPVIVFVGVFSAISGYLFSGSLGIVMIAVMAIIFSLPIARFAIPARMGNTDEGFLSDQVTWKESFQYSIRYSIANLVWLIPVIIFGLIIGLVGGDSSGSSFNPNPYSLMTSGSGMVFVVLMIFSMLGPLLALLVTTATDEISELFDKDLWLSFVTVYRDELVIFCANVIGAVFMFWLLFAVPLLVIAAIAFAVSDAFGAIVLGFIALLPAAISPIILGRLAGALVYSIEQEEMDDVDADNEHSQNQDQSQEQTKTTAQTASNAPLAKGATVTESSGSLTASIDHGGSNENDPLLNANNIADANPHGSKLKLIEQKLTKIDALKKNNAILLAQNAQKTTPDEPYHFAEEVLIHCQFEAFEEALPLANRAIPKAINFGDQALTFKLFNALGNHRVKLKLAPPVILRLKQCLLEGGHFLMAVQAILILIKMQPDDQAHKEMILDIAFKARQKNSKEQSKKIYAFFIKKYADNPLINIAQKGLSELS
jgi:hypothetical protein